MRGLPCDSLRAHPPSLTFLPRLVRFLVRLRPSEARVCDLSPPDALNIFPLLAEVPAGSCPPVAQASACRALSVSADDQSANELSTAHGFSSIAHRSSFRESAGANQSQSPRWARSGAVPGAVPANLALEKYHRILLAGKGTWRCSTLLSRRCLVGAWLLGVEPCDMARHTASQTLLPRAVDGGVPRR